jgi:signal transduction histidine kinase
MDDGRTDHRVITISSRVEDSKGCGISIADSGAGIPEDKLEEIFQPFYTTKAKGLGLGLAISKLIIESHEGKIWAENNPGKGAKFVIFLPGNI